MVISAVRCDFAKLCSQKLKCLFVGVKRVIHLTHQICKLKVNKTGIDSLVASLTLEINFRDDVAKAKTALLERRSALLDKSEQRKTRLQDSFTYHQFDRDCDEAKGWFNEKLKVATDDSYLDPTNLNGKVQKHQSFEVELDANKKRVDDIVSVGQDLIESDHDKRDNIAVKLEEITQLWKDLVSATETKSIKLQEASQQQHFNRGIEDLELWLSEIEGQINSEDYGKVRRIFVK